jgi:hypothetical protein
MNLSLALRAFPIRQFIFYDFQTISPYNGLSATTTISIFTALAGDIPFIDISQSGL